MAKRFTDTGLVRKAWFRKLPPHLKAAWFFLLAECDCAGVWSIDEESLSFHIGWSSSVGELLAAFNEDGETRLIRIDKDKLWLPGFISFQYGELSPDCKPHQKVIARLKELTLWDSTRKGMRYPLQRVQEEEEEKEKEEEKEIQGGVGGNDGLRHVVAPDQINLCLEEWKQTLEHFEIQRGIGERDQIEIARAVQQSGSEWVRLALQGARKQKAGPRFDPKQFVSLRIYLDPKRIERLVNIGAGRESADGIDWQKVFGGAT